MLFTIVKHPHKHHKYWLWCNNLEVVQVLTPMALRRFWFHNISWSENTLKNHPTWCRVFFLKWCDHCTTTLATGGWNCCIKRNFSKDLTQCMKVHSQLRALRKRIIFVVFFFISLCIHVELFHQGYTHQQLFIMQHRPHHFLYLVVLHIILSKSLWLVSSMPQRIGMSDFCQRFSIVDNEPSSFGKCRPHLQLDNQQPS